MRLSRQQRSSLLLAFLIVLLLVILLAGFWSYRTLKDLRDFKTHLDSLDGLASGDLAQMDLQGAAQEVEGLRSNMLALHRDARPFLWLTPYLGWVPGFGPDILAAQDLMTIGLKLTEAGDLLLEAFSPVLEAGIESPDLRKLATSSLMKAQPQLEQAQALVADAVQARTGIEAEELSEQLQGYLTKLDRYLPMAELALDASLVASDLLGLYDPQAYLVIAQNNDELRATGGFITAAGRVVLREGKIAEMSFMDSYAVDDFSNYYPDPPQALYDTMLAEQWLFRDSNWSPDFPTAAQQMATFFEMGTGQAVDGVIAMDMIGLRILVDAVGPLSIAGEEAPLSGAEVVEWMQSTRGGLEEGEALGEWWVHRKDFMGPLADAFKYRLESGQVDWIQLVKAVHQVVREKHLLFYFVDVEAQTLLKAQSLDGPLKPAQSDYWMIVDSNVGINKADANIEREILYQISMARDGSLLANLEIHYRNRTPAGDEPCDPNPRYSEIYQGETQRCYWDYLRVYVPQMAELLQMPSAPLPEISLPGEKLNRGGEETFQVLESEAGKQVFSLYFLLPRGEEQKWSFSYRLPPDTLQNENGRWHYRLDIQKQPGKRTEQVQVILVLPGVSEIFYVDPQPRDVLSDEVRFSFGLETDLVLQLEFQVNE